jgi:hypothetical protein
MTEKKGYHGKIMTEERTILKIIRDAYKQQGEGIKVNVKGWNELPIENKVALLIVDIVKDRKQMKEVSGGVYEYLNRAGIKDVRDIKHELKKMRL